MTNAYVRSATLFSVADRTYQPVSADDRPRALRWFQENADAFLDFDVLEDRERSGL
ncbi:hypothetical protein OG889_21650 [Streptomyces sp. NBC_00481]|uniref:hypothetical protein n=1 Tax=unclassified Streptomyces TaxID=2593676 RepID=UPI002DD9B364|nr:MULTISPECIES: hypothetical protein [unclassified Streptomyces]WRY97106.1 hypothetical protein OG889_21650 [Streptomyces sp. NBC_00481]